MAEGNVLGVAIVKLMLQKAGFNADMANVKQQTTKSIGGITSAVSKLAGVGVGLYALKQAVMTVHKAFVDFDRDMHNIWTLTDQTKEQVVELSNELRNLAWEYNVTSSEAAKAMYQIYSATFYGADAMKILESSARGAAAGLTDVFTAANMGTTVLNAYGMEAKEIAHVNDLLFTAIRYGKTTYGELASQFGRLAGVAAPVGASIEEMAAAIATLTRQGIATDWAVTSLRQTLMKMLQPTKELEKAINDLGYSSGGAMIKAVGFANSIKQVTDWAAANGVEISKMFTNVRAVTAVLPLATTAAAGFAKDLQRMADAGGAADDAFFKQTGSWAYQLEILKTRLNDIGITLGKLVTPAITGFLEAIMVLLRPIGLLAEGLELIGGPNLLRYVVTLGTLAVGFRLLAKSIRMAAGAMGQMMLSGGLLGRSLRGLTDVGAKVLGTASWSKGLAGGLGMAGIGLGGAALALKGLVNLNLAFGELTGAEATKKAIEGALESAVGGVIAGAMVGKLLGFGMLGSTGIGAAVGVAAGLSIYVYHIIKKEADDRAASVDIVSRTMATYGDLPLEMPATAESITALRDELSLFNPEIERTKEFFGATTTAIELMYNRVGISARDLHGTYKLKPEYSGVITLAGITGIEVPVEDVEAAAMLWNRALIDVTIGSFADLTKSTRRLLPKGMQDYIDEMDKIAGEAILDAQWPDFGAAITDIMREWGESVNAEIDTTKMGVLVEIMGRSKAAFGALGEKPVDDINKTAEENEAAMNAWLAAGKAAAEYSTTAQEVFTNLTKDMSEDERIATFFKIVLSLAGDTATNLAYVAELMEVTTQETVDKVMAIINEGLAPPAAPDVPVATVQEQIDKASAAFDEAFEAFQTGDGLLGQSVTQLEAMRTTASAWAANAEAAEIGTREYAEAVRELADRMAELVAAGADEAMAAIIVKFNAAKKAYLAAADGSLEQAVAVKDLTSVSEELYKLQVLLGLSAEDLAGDWKDMAAWLDSIGIKIQSIVALDFAEQIGVLQAALSEAISSGNIAAQVAALSGLQSVYGSMVGSLDMLSAAGMGGSEVLNVLILSLENLYGFTREAAGGVDELGDAIDGMLDAISGAISEFSGLIKEKSPVMGSILDMGASFVGAASTAKTVYGTGGTVDASLAAAAAGEGLNELVLTITGVAAGFGALLSVTGAIVGVFMAIRANEERKQEELAAAAEEARQGLLSIVDAASSAASALWDLAQQAESVQRLQSAWMTLQEKLISALFGFLWPIVGILEMITGSLEDSTDAIEEETEARRASLNVPTGYKVRRTEWRAATPGQPGDLIEDDSSVTDDIEETLTWWQQMVLEFGSAVEDVIAPFRNFINTLNAAWESIAPAIVQAAIPVLDTFGWTLDQLGGWITDILAPDLEKFAEGFETFWTDKVDPFWKDDMGPKVAEWFNRIYSWIEPVLEWLEGPFWDWLSGPVWEAVQPYVEDVLEMFEDLGKWVAMHWDDIKDDLLVNLETSLSSLVDAIKAAVIWIFDFLGLPNPFEGEPGGGGMTSEEAWNNAYNNDGTITVNEDDVAPITGIDDETSFDAEWAQWLIDHPSTDSSDPVATPTPSTDYSNGIPQYQQDAITNAGFGGIIGSTGQWVPYSTLNGVPVEQLAKGGKLLTDGLVFGHKNEIVMPASVAPLSAGMGGGGSFGLVNHVTVTLDGRVLTKEITREKRFQEKIMTGSPNGRRWEAVGA